MSNKIFNIFNYDQKIRFILVGLWNTIFGFLSFVLFYKFLQRLITFEEFQYTGAMLLGQIVSVVNAFFMHKFYTFRSETIGYSSLKEFIRFNNVYIFTLVLNLISLPFLVEILDINPVEAGGICIILTTLVSYLGHSKYSFKANYDI